MDRRHPVIEEIKQLEFQASAADGNLILDSNWLMKNLIRALEQGRADDKIEVFERRMENYNTQTKPLAGLYHQESLLAEINGIGTIEEVFSRIKSIIDGLNGIINDKTSLSEL